VTKATLTEVARTLGVTVNQVYMWHQRRDKNKFPDVVAYSPEGSRLGGRKNTKLFNLEDVQEWYDRHYKKV